MLVLTGVTDGCCEGQGLVPDDWATGFFPLGTRPQAMHGNANPKMVGREAWKVIHILFWGSTYLGYHNIPISPYFPTLQTFSNFYFAEGYEDRIWKSMNFHDNLQRCQIYIFFEQGGAFSRLLDRRWYNILMSHDMEVSQNGGTPKSS